MKTFNSKQLASQIADHEDTHLKTTKDITDAMFKMVAKVMKEGDRENYSYKNIRIINFGVFGVKDGRIEHYKKKDKKNGK